MVTSARETELRSIRTRNQQLFDAQWGSEEYLIIRGVAETESYINNVNELFGIYYVWHLCSFFGVNL